MSTKLIIVESPSKATTIEKYLKGEYKVIASKGHIRDLPIKELGIDIEDDFKMHDVTMEGKEAVIKLIKAAAKDATEIFLASDPDREGEKISQSIYEILPKKGKIIKRITFNSVTKEAIEKSLKNAGDIDEKKCEAQKTRRIVDRLVGYKISPLLWNKIQSGVSAGRVQSVALRIIVEREDEIRAFVPQTWFTIIVKFKKDEISFSSEYFGKTITKKVSLDNKEDADKILKDITGKDFTVVDIKVKDKEQKPTPPFTTSKMQQEAASKLKFDSKKTMQVAQKLYERGYITYMRTDSVRVEPDAIKDVRTYIESTYGKDYLPDAEVQYKDKKKGNVQDAHEAIRPTKLENTADKIRGSLTSEEYELYSLIFQKFVSSQMSNAELEETIVMLECESHFFKTSGSVLKFDGFKKAFSDQEEEKKVKKGEEEETELAVLPVLTKDEKLTPTEAPKVFEKKTSPPPRFTEATLVKELEDKGIGRPSTYASIISNITSRTYVEKEKNRFKPSSLGEQICRALIEFFPKEMDVKFTAGVEADLDQIEDGNIDHLKFLKEFWKSLESSINTAIKDMKKTRVDNAQTTGIKCLVCSDGEYVVKSGKNGEFLACNNYPACRSTQNFETVDGQIKIAARKQQLTDKICPKCSRPMALKKSGKSTFYGCSGYPECRATLPMDSTGIKCSKCNKGEIVPKISKNKNKFWGCSNYPDCNQVYWKEEDFKKEKTE